MIKSSNNSPIRCAIIGYGYMGEIRRRVIESNPDLELTSICDQDIEKIPKVDNILATSKTQDIVSSIAEAVFVCTPNHLIPNLTVECLDNGKHVFCEKPPGRTVADIDMMRQAEKRNPGAKLMFGFNHRYHPGVMRAKAIIDTGRFGDILTIRGLYGKSGGKNFTKSWRNNPKVSGGGILLDQGIHMLDLFHFFIGEFSSVKSFMTSKHWGFDVEDNAVVIAENKAGQLGMLHSSATFWKHAFQVSIILQKGYLVVDGLLSKTGSYGRETLTIGKRQFEDEAAAIGNPSEEITYFDTDESWDLEVGTFVKSIQTGTPIIESTSKDALNVMKLIHRCYEESGLLASQSGEH